MTSRSNDDRRSLINYERTWKTVICLNPEHEGSLQFDTNEVGDIYCPMCNSQMVVLVKTPLSIVKRDELD